MPTSYTPREKIDRAAEPVIEGVERDRERALVAEVEQGLGTGRAAAAGLDEALEMLKQQRVDTLLIPDRSELSAGLCATGNCGRRRPRTTDTAGLMVPPLARSTQSSTQSRWRGANPFRSSSRDMKLDRLARMVRSRRGCDGETHTL
jgi:hypothetical protein